MTTININDRAYKFGNGKSDRAFVRLMTAEKPANVMTVAAAVAAGLATVEERTTKRGLSLVTIRRANGRVTEVNGADLATVLGMTMAF